MVGKGARKRRGRKERGEGKDVEGCGRGCETDEGVEAKGGREEGIDGGWPG